MQTPWNASKLIGKKFGKLRVISKAESKLCGKTKVSMWICKCKCGNTTEPIQGRSLKSGNTKSCGHCPNRLAHNRKGYGEMAGGYWSHIKHNANMRNLDFSILEKYVWETFLTQNRKCAISGVELFFSQNYIKNPKLQTASLDRIDSSKGYIEGNIQWIHKDINLMKNASTDKQLLDWCETIVNYQRSKSFL